MPTNAATAAAVTCRELLQRLMEALERDEVDWAVLRKLVNKCGSSFVLEAGRAFAKKVAHYAMSAAWRYYRSAAIAGRHPVIAYVAEAAARYQ
ncbi:MAG: hypothetical protein ACO2PM_13130 [Pyrobaculum sp.]|jgi:hypothetical protein